MDTQQKETTGKKPFNDREQLRLLAIIAFSLVLAIYLIAVSVQRVQLRRDCTEARNLTAACVEDQITLFLRTYDSITQPGADVRYDLLPDLQTYFYAMQELDDTLTYAYGSAYTFVQPSLRTNIKMTLSAYEQAFRNGKNTDSAYASLTDCVSQLKLTVEGRFDSNGNVLPRSK